MQLLESEHGSFLHDVNNVNIITCVLKMLPYIILHCCVFFHGTDHTEVAHSDEGADGGV